ncbi:unnamed protein product [Closterium sp. Yama58-4]|nr:unnamed protein product [Closterium sp. Yama58-4]
MPRLALVFASWAASHWDCTAIAFVVIIYIFCIHAAAAVAARSLLGRGHPHVDSALRCAGALSQRAKSVAMATPSQSSSASLQFADSDAGGGGGGGGGGRGRGGSSGGASFATGGKSVVWNEESAYTAGGGNGGDDYGDDGVEYGAEAGPPPPVNRTQSETTRQATHSDSDSNPPEVRRTRSDLIRVGAGKGIQKSARGRPGPDSRDGPAGGADGRGSVDGYGGWSQQVPYQGSTQYEEPSYNNEQYGGGEMNGYHDECSYSEVGSQWSGMEQEDSLPTVQKTKPKAKAKRAIAARKARQSEFGPPTAPAAHTRCGSPPPLDPAGTSCGSDIGVNVGRGTVGGAGGMGGIGGGGRGGSGMGVQEADCGRVFPLSSSSEDDRAQQEMREGSMTADGGGWGEGGGGGVGGGGGGVAEGGAGALFKERNQGLGGPGGPGGAGGGAVGGPGGPGGPGGALAQQQQQPVPRGVRRVQSSRDAAGSRVVAVPMTPSGASQIGGQASSSFGQFGFSGAPGSESGGGGGAGGGGGGVGVGGGGGGVGGGGGGGAAGAGVFRRMGSARMAGGGGGGASASASVGGPVAAGTPLAGVGSSSFRRRPAGEASGPAAAGDAEEARPPMRRSSTGGEQYRRKIWVNGQAVPDQRVVQAEQRIGPIDPGKYWYDSRAGFWGVMGGPSLGVLPAFMHEFGNHPMEKDCSGAGGKTRVYVNGREVPKKELTALTKKGLLHLPGANYTLEADGTVVDNVSGKAMRSIGNLVDEKKRGTGMFNKAGNVPNPVFSWLTASAGKNKDKGNLAGETALRLVSEAYCPPPDSPMNEFLCLSHVAGDPLVGQAVSGPPPKLTVLLVGDDSTAKRSFLECWKDTLTGEGAASAVPGVTRALDHVPAARDLLSVHVCISKDRYLPCIDFVDLPLPSLPQSAASPIPPLSSAPAGAAPAPPAAANAAALSEATAALGATADVIIVFMSVAAVRAPSSRLANQLALLLSPSNTQQQQQLADNTPRLDRLHFVAVLPQSKASAAAAGTAATVVDYLRSNVKVGSLTVTSQTAAAVASSVNLPPSLAPAADMRIQVAAVGLLVLAYLVLHSYATILDRAPPSAAASDRSKLRVFKAFCDMALTFCGARRL